MKTKQVTKEEAVRAANESCEAALDSCIKHWEHNFAHSIAELREACLENPANLKPISWGLCALCQRFRFSCVGCPLVEHRGPGQVCSEAYHEADYAYDTHDEGLWTRVCETLLQQLKDIRNAK